MELAILLPRLPVVILMQFVKSKRVATGFLRKSRRERGIIGGVEKCGDGVAP